MRNHSSIPISKRMSHEFSKIRTLFVSDPLCSICTKPVPLDTAKTDEGGRAIHEECYLQKLQSKAS